MRAATWFRSSALPLFRGALVVLATCAPALAADPVKTDDRRTATLAAAFAETAAKVAPSVVNVLSPEGDELGFGVAIEDGTYVLTSRSILERTGAAGWVELKGPRGTVGSASILGRNEAYDVALLKLQARGARLEPAALGRSGALAIGQWVVTMGALGDRPLAVGVVSALGRRVEPRDGPQALDLFGLFTESAGPTRAYARVIQHDSPIDTDAHGAPLVDADGRLVGINVARAYRGSSFAAPIDEVRAFLDDLKAGRAGPAMPRPGFLGLTIGSIHDREVAKRVGVAGAGVEIREVAAGLAAEKAGLRKGDVVLAVGGSAVRSHEAFGKAVREALPGSTLSIRILRDGEELEINAVVGERPAGE